MTDKELQIKVELLAAVICSARDKADEIVSMLGRDHSARLWEDIMALAAALYAAMETDNR